MITGSRDLEPGRNQDDHSKHLRALVHSERESSNSPIPEIGGSSSSHVNGPIPIVTLANDGPLRIDFTEAAVKKAKSAAFKSLETSSTSWT